MGYYYAYIFLLLFNYNCFNKPNQLKFNIKNQKSGTVYLLGIKGDKQTLIDSIEIHEVTDTITFSISSATTPGMYRINLGKTRLAEIMNEPPQQLDFIFNNEDIIFETDFKVPEDSLKVLQSEENRVWFEFKKHEKEYKAQINEVEQEIDYYREIGVRISNSNNEVKNHITLYNRLQNERDELISKNIVQYPNLFATNLIKMYREAFLNGNLSELQRKEIFKNDFFKPLDFSDETLINTSIYTENAFQYLMAFAQKGLTREQQEQEFLKATEIILENVNKNPLVYEFVLDYLVRGFEKMNLENVLKSVAEKYEGTTCQTDEKTTLEKAIRFSEIHGTRGNRP